MAFSNGPVFDEKKYASDDHIEHLEGKAEIINDKDALSGIEATAASRAAWLISITISLGGFLFGMICC